MRRLKIKLIFWLTKKLIPLTTDRDIISFAKSKDGKSVAFLNKKPLTEKGLANLQSEVLFLKESEIWKLINHYFEHLAQKKLYTDSADITDLVFGKTILYTLSVQKTIISNILNATNGKEKNAKN